MYASMSLCCLYSFDCGASYCRFYFEYLHSYTSLKLPSCQWYYSYSVAVVFNYCRSSFFSYRCFHSEVVREKMNFCGQEAEMWEFYLQCRYLARFIPLTLASSQTSYLQNFPDLSLGFDSPTFFLDLRLNVYPFNYFKII